MNTCLDNWKHRLELDNARAALCKLAACTRQTFLSETFTHSLNMQKQYEENVWETSNDTYSLSVRVQTTINHISIYFWPQHQRQRKCFSSERELKKALRDTLTRAAWSGLYKTSVVSMSQCYVIKQMVNAIACTIEFWIHLGGLLSTQEARVALGCRLVRLLRFFRA